MKLSTRLALIVGSAVLGAIILVIFALQTINSTMQKERHAQIQLMITMAHKQANVYLALEKNGTLSRDEAQTRAKQALAGMREGDDYVFVRNMEGLVLVHVDPRKEGKVDMGSTMPDGRNLMQTYVDSLKDSTFSLVNIKTKRPKGDVEVLKINGLAKIPDWGWIIGFGLFADDIDQAYWHNALRFLLIGLVVFSAVIFAGFAMSRSLYRHLGGEPDDAATAALSIAKGHLNQRISSNGSPGNLMESIATMQESLRKIVENIQHSATQVGQASSNLSGQMSHINEASRLSSDATASTAAAIEEMAVSIDHISQSAKETEANSVHAAELAARGNTLVNKATEEIQRASTQVTEASALIAGLVDRSREIGGLAGIIKDIADQTNLLALNAAIEAARAGEQGRGFAVVADEVRKLAERTSGATSQITRMINAIQIDTSAVVNSMEAVSPQVARGVSMAEEAGVALHEISENSKATLGKIRDVAEATTEQSQASSSVANSVEKISMMVEESAASVRAANENVVALEQLATDLRSSVSRFQL